MLLAAGSILESMNSDGSAVLEDGYVGLSDGVMLQGGEAPIRRPRPDKDADRKQADQKPPSSKTDPAKDKSRSAKSDKAKSKPKQNAGKKPGAKKKPATSSPVTGGIPSLASGQDVAIIRIEGAIDDYSLLSLRHRVKRAKAEGVTVIVLELDTPGGRMDSSLKISRFVKQLNPQFHTIAWVHDEAYSAGSLIAAACNHIVMSSRSTIGDTAPIVPGYNLAPTERAKFLSPLLEEFRDSAKHNGYDFAMFHSMCQIGVRLYLIEYAGKQHLVNQADYEVMVKGQALPSQLKGVTKSGVPSVPGAPSSNIDVVSPELATDADRGKWKPVELVNGIKFPGGLVHDGKDKLLTLNQDRATAIGLNQGFASDDKELEKLLNAGSMVRIESMFTHTLGYWLTRPWMKAILVLIMIIGGLVEMSAPGVGIGGVVAISAVVLLIVGPILSDLWQIWPLLLFFVGLALLLVEIFVTPGFGLIGAAGIVAMFVGVALLGLPSNVSTAEWLGHLQSSLAWMLASVVGTIVAVFLISKHYGRLPMFDRLILTDSNKFAVETDSVTSYAQAVKGTDAEVTPEAGSISGDEVIGHGQIKVGDTGRVITELHPTGSIEIDGQVIDVISCGQWIEIGKSVQVVEIQGNRIVVDDTRSA